MKVALQLSGRLKFSNESLGSLIQSIVNTTKPDIFCSFWSPKKSQTAQIIDHHLKPKLCEYEDHDLVRPYLDRLFNGKKIYPNLPVMAYKFHRVSMVRQMYERSANIKYDCVIQARTDCIFFEIFDSSRCQESLDKNSILCTNFMQPYIDTFIQPTIRDNFYLGPAQLVDRANSEFWHLLNQIEDYEERKLNYHNLCTEIIQSKVWKNLGIPVQPLYGLGQSGTYFQGHFAYDVDRRKVEFFD